MARARRVRDEAQGDLFAPPTLKIPSDGYSEERARAAALRRDARIKAVARQRRVWLKDESIDGADKLKIKHLAEAKRTNTFTRRTDGLFVPLNGTERRAIVTMPIVKAEAEKDNARQRVYEKYKDSDVATKKVDLWAHFSGQRSHDEIRQKYRSYRDKSAVNAGRIAMHLDRVSGGEIARDLFTYDPDYRIDQDTHSPRQDILAYNSVLKYLIALESFAVLDVSVLGKEGTVKWPRYKGGPDLRSRMERAHQELENVADDIFAERIDEAYWSFYSRERFWVAAVDEHEQFLADRRRYRRQVVGIDEPPLYPPIDLYVSGNWIPNKQP